MVAISINSFPWLIAPPWCVNEHKLSLAIYVKGKIFRGSHASTIILYLNMFTNEIFSVEKFPNYGITCAYYGNYNI